MSILDEILAHKRQEVEQSAALKPLSEIKAALNDSPPRVHGRFERALRDAGRPALIAEIKKASPSKGLIREDFEPASLARAYAAGGASCLSVLTDVRYFQGHPDYLVRAREASGLPVLRKDFIVSEYQLYESALLGADCILLIAAALDDIELPEFAATAAGLGMDCLVEVHDTEEAARVCFPWARIVGVNNRDLRTFRVALETSERLAGCLPVEAVKVSESGIHSRADLDRLTRAGYDAVLVGESLMRCPDIESATRDLLGR